MEETNQPERGSEDIYGAFALRTIMADTMAGRMHTGDGQKYLILFSILAGAVYEAWNVRYMIAAAFELACNANFRTRTQSLLA
jgi:hypothetical protein